MSSTRRRSLQAIGHTPAVHAGLWLDKYLGGPPARGAAEEQPQTRLVREVAATGEPGDYAAAYGRWRAGLRAMAPQSEADELLLQEAEVQGRIVVGLGDESAIETSITLDRCYGVPQIPGSALKGLAAHHAHRVLGAQDARWRIGGAAHTTLFGAPEAAGYVRFFAAWYVPGSAGAGGPLRPDVISVHHPDYYGAGKAGPADWDNPTIVALLSATGRYLLALSGPQPWAGRALEILGAALAHDGVGARSSSGYGRLRPAGAAERVALAAAGREGER